MIMLHAIWEFTHSADCIVQSRNPQIACQSADCIIMQLTGPLRNPEMYSVHCVKCLLKGTIIVNKSFCYCQIARLLSP